MKFHHGQKVKIIGDYYKSYKGFVRAFRDNKDKSIDYEIHIKKLSKEDSDFVVWINEKNLKVSLF